MHVLAGVRAARQGANHRPPAARPPGGLYRARRTRRSQRRRRPRSSGGRAGPSETRVGTRYAAGLPRHHARVLRGELLRRVDPRHRSLGQFFQDEIASPLGLDVYIRLPEEIPNSRLATIAPPTSVEMLLRLPAPPGAGHAESSFEHLPGARGSDLPIDEQRVYARNLEVPSGGAVGTARAIARAYSVFATGGRELGLRAETLDLLAAPAIPPSRGFYDECMKGEACSSRWAS